MLQDLHLLQAGVTLGYLGLDLLEPRERGPTGAVLGAGQAHQIGLPLITLHTEPPDEQRQRGPLQQQGPDHHHEGEEQDRVAGREL